MVVCGRLLWFLIFVSKVGILFVVCLMFNGLVVRGCECYGLL